MPHDIARRLELFEGRVALGAQLVPFFGRVLAHGSAQLPLGAFVALVLDAGVMLHEILLELRGNRAHGAHLLRQPRVRVGQLGAIILLHAQHDVRRGATAARVEGGDPRFDFAALVEERRNVLHLGRTVIGHRFALRASSARTSAAANCVTAPICNAAHTMRAACSRLSMRWCASPSVRPTVTAP